MSEMSKITTIEIDDSLDRLGDWDFFDEKVIGKFSGFRAASGNVFGLRRRIIDRESIYDEKKGPYGDMFELAPGGIHHVTVVPMKFHVTNAGTPHRVPHSFGYWHINDLDEVYVAIPAPEGETRGHFVVVMQKPVGKEGESFAWYCEACLLLIDEYRFDHGRLGLNEFWRAEMEAVARHNEGDRQCPECGHVNPLGYTWNTVKDTAELKAARLHW
ncbi:MAG TPA: hypothetical protein VGP41_00725 [Candidatus Lustribacter sp.]|jgi:hypothetical protein|nr:hypothetical protein [Candidatus Lustribacter sp.]